MPVQVLIWEAIATELAGQTGYNFLYANAIRANPELAMSYFGLLDDYALQVDPSD